MMVASPYTEPVEEKAISRTPAARIASSRFCVAIRFCSMHLHGSLKLFFTSAFAAK